MLLFWSRSGKLTRSLFSFPLKGWDSSLLFRLDLTYFSRLVGQIILSPTPFLLSLSRKKVFWVQFLLSLLFGQNYSKSNFIFTKKFSDDSKFCLSRKIIPTSQRYSKSQSLSDLEKLAFMLFHSILSPLESKQCPLTLASVLASANSVDELRFWNKSES